jgi:hypothetical protein
VPQDTSEIQPVRAFAEIVVADSTKASVISFPKAAAETVETQTAPERHELLNAA